MATFNNDITTYASLPDWANYTLIAVMFILIILLVFGIILFAKWLTMGPKLRIKWHKLLGKASIDKGLDGVKIKGKEVIIQDGYVEEIQEKIKNANTPQELLEYQIQLEKHVKQKDTFKSDIKAKEDEKLEKLETKVENKALKSEAKEEANKLKLEEKELKSKEKIKKQEEKQKEKEGKNG